MVAYMFVLLGVVRQTTAIRVIYLDIILYSIGGVIPLCWLCARALRYRNPNRSEAEAEIPARLFTVERSAGGQ
jgi:hypothetical protein